MGEKQNKKYKVELTEKQMKVVLCAIEEYFRLRMGQSIDFCEDLASMGHDLSPDNPNHDWIFNNYISRRDHLCELMHAFFRIAFEPTGYKSKTEDMLVAECVWDSMRFSMGISRWGSVLQIGGEPAPKIEIVEE